MTTGPRSARLVRVCSRVRRRRAAAPGASASIVRSAAGGTSSTTAENMIKKPPPEKLGQRFLTNLPESWPSFLSVSGSPVAGRWVSKSWPGSSLRNYWGVGPGFLSVKFS